MGIKKGLLSFIKKKYPTIIKNAFINEFENQTIAIDIFSFLYRYIHTFGKDDNKWISSMFKHFLIFKKYNIKILPIFDGKPPVEKNDERQFRKEKKEQEDKKVKSLKEDYQHYLDTGEVSELLDHTNSYLTRQKQQVSLFKSKLFKNNNKPKIDNFEIENYLDTLKHRSNFLSKSDIQLIKELFDVVRIPYIQAEDEAETLACYLLNEGLVDNVISLDSDCIAYGIGKFIIDINQRGNCIVFDVDELVKQTGLTKDQITDLCIICQCDYNSCGNGIEGVGPARALNLLKTHVDIEGILQTGYKHDNLNYQRCREIFRSKYPNMHDPIKTIDFDKKINIDEVESFIKLKNIYINMNDFKFTYLNNE
jgi:5'-3' exonuclease